MTAFDLFSVGHSNIPADRFVAMQRAVGVTAIADVRSTPFSRFCPWFSAKNLAPLLANEGIGYSAYGVELGGRPHDAALYRDGIADYEAMARQADVCVMCSEREPLECHRCLLVTRALAARGLTVGHILHDGTIESHAATEQRLLKLEGEGEDLFVTGQNERLAAAYFRRARAVAYRSNTGAAGAKKAAARKK
jgi:uncharacterized protein (DUF488 family)